MTKRVIESVSKNTDQKLQKQTLVDIAKAVFKTATDNNNNEVTGFCFCLLDSFNKTKNKKTEMESDRIAILDGTIWHSAIESSAGKKKKKNQNIFL